MLTSFFPFCHCAQVIFALREKCGSIMNRNGKLCHTQRQGCNVIIVLTNSLPFGGLAHIQQSDINTVLWAHAASRQILPKCQTASWMLWGSQGLISKVVHVSVPGRIHAPSATRTAHCVGAAALLTHPLGKPPKSSRNPSGASRPRDTLHNFLQQTLGAISSQNIKWTYGLALLIENFFSWDFFKSFY